MEIFGPRRHGTGESKSRHAANELELLRKSFSKKNRIENKNHEGTVDPRTQNATPPEETKSHRALH